MKSELTIITGLDTYDVIYKRDNPISLYNTTLATILGKSYGNIDGIKSLPSKMKSDLNCMKSNWPQEPDLLVISSLSGKFDH